MNMIEKRKAMAGQGGFTLIELLVVVAILAVLAGAAIIGIGAMRENAQATACKSDRDTVETAAEAYDIDHLGEDGFVAGALTSVQPLIDDGYLKKGVVEGDFTLDGSSGSYVATAGDGKYTGDVLEECNP